MRGPIGRKLPGHPAREKVPQVPVQAVERSCTLCNQVNNASRVERLYGEWFSEGVSLL
jgi:hypothetical protein